MRNWFIRLRRDGDAHDKTVATRTMRDAGFDMWVHTKHMGESVPVVRVAGFPNEDGTKLTTRVWLIDEGRERELASVTYNSGRSPRKKTKQKEPF